jgi:hypothetical protein
VSEERCHIKEVETANSKDSVKQEDKSSSHPTDDLIQHHPTSILLPPPPHSHEECTPTLPQRFYATDIKSLTQRRKKRAENEGAFVEK